MATKYWVGGTGSMNDTNHWSLSSGGAGGAGVPLVTEDVIFDTSSSVANAAYTVSVTSGATCKNFTMDGPDPADVNKVTFTGSFGFTISGNLDLVGGTAGINYTSTGSPTMTATSLSVTLKTYGVKILAALKLNNLAATYTLLDDIELGSDLTVTGILDATTNNTTVKMTPAAFGFLTTTYTQAFYNFTYIAPFSVVGLSVNLASNITVSNALIMTGYSSTARMVIASTKTDRTRTVITANGTVSFSNCDFVEIEGAGTASWDLSAMPGLSGDRTGNVGITFSPAIDQHWVNPNGGSWYDAVNWTSRVPMAQDNVYFDCVFGADKIITCDNSVWNLLGNNIDFSGASWTGTLSCYLAGTVFGNLTLNPGILIGTTASKSTSLAFNCKTPGQTLYINIPTARLPIDKSFNFNGGLTTTYRLANDLTGANTTSSVGITGGIFYTDNYNMTCSAINFTGGLAEAYLGTSTITLLNLTGTIVNMGTTFGTFSALDSTLKSIGVGTSSTVVLTMSGKAFGTIWLDRGVSTNQVNFQTNGPVSIKTLRDTGTAAHSLGFQFSQTFTITNFLVSGSAGKLVTIKTNSGTSVHNLVKAGGGTISCDYLSIEHSVATPANTWYAGTHSVNNQATPTVGSGWIFTDAPIVLRNMVGIGSISNINNITF